MSQLLSHCYYIPKSVSICASVRDIKAAQGLNPHLGLNPCLVSSSQDFKVKPCRGYKHLLVLVCTYSQWPNAFPTENEKATEVCRVFLREIIPRKIFPNDTQ